MNYEETLSYKSHGVWVKHKKWGLVGRIAYYNKTSEKVVVVWDPGPKYPLSNKRIKTPVSGEYDKADLARLKRTPTPWYKRFRGDGT